ncbi:hypothetical protein, partial [Pseudobacteroides cellulosolvens]|uniref:hypothetical protein n=1 Tax=Pseudobacteroides cellulosolvens TaxID=35825 RepID=UPI00056741A0
MRDQCVIWLKLNCLKPSALTLTLGDVRRLIDKHMKRFYENLALLVLIISETFQAYKKYDKG